MVEELRRRAAERAAARHAAAVRAAQYQAAQWLALVAVETSAQLLQDSWLRMPSYPARGRRPIRPPGASWGSGRSCVPRRAASAPRALGMAPAARLSVRPRRGCSAFHRQARARDRGAAPRRRAAQDGQGGAAGCKCRVPCLRTAPHQPPWTTPRLAPRRGVCLRTPARHLSSSKARRGPSSPPQPVATPRTFRASTPRRRSRCSASGGSG